MPLSPAPPAHGMLAVNLLAPKGMTGWSAMGLVLGTVGAFGCASLVDESWPMIFYLFGGLGLVWAAAFALLAGSTLALTTLHCQLALGQLGVTYVKAAQQRKNRRPRSRGCL